MSKAFYDNDVYSTYREGKQWCVTKNGYIWLSGVKSKEEADKIADMCNQDQYKEDKE